MLTPAEITGKEFERAVFNGYTMPAVDSFMEELGADYAALYKENSILKQKIKVLVEKVEEYRSTEDAMRAALLTAQKTGETLLTEANRQCTELLTRAETEARRRMTEADTLAADEQARLRAARAETARFVEASEALLKQHAAFLSRLDTIRQEPPAPAPEPTREETIIDAAEEIGSAVEKLVSEAAAPEASPAAQAPAFEDESEPTKTYLPKAQEELEETSPRPKFDFENLQFGPNFTKD